MVRSKAKPADENHTRDGSAVRTSTRTEPQHAARPPGSAPHQRIDLRRPSAADGAAMHRLAVAAGLDRNSPYAYLMCAHYFDDTCLVAIDRDEGDRLAGFITGFRPPKSPDSLFVWQIGVAESHRGQRLSGRMLRTLLARTAAHGVRYLEATVSPTNVPSQRAFRGVARDLDTSCEETMLFDASLFEGSADVLEAHAPNNPHAPHEAEVLFRIGPFDPERLTSVRPDLAGPDPAAGTEGSLGR